MGEKIIYGISNNDGRDKWAVVDCPYPDTVNEIPSTYVWSEMTEHWLGAFSFNFDKYLVMDNSDIYGMKSGETYKLNEGEKINNTDIVSWVLSAASPQQVNDKEFLRIRINSNNKPDLVEFYTSMDDYLNEDPKAKLDPTSNPLHLKNYYGFEQYIPRREDNGDRMQGRVMLFKITQSEIGKEFTLVDTEVQYKTLK